MLTVIELVIFFTLTFGALGILSLMIAEWLAERGIWPMGGEDHTV